MPSGKGFCQRLCWKMFAVDPLKIFLSLFPCLAFFFVLVTVTSANSEQLAPAVPRELTLEDAIEIALKNHPTIRQASEAVKAAAARVGQAESAYYPQISLDAGYSKYDSFQPNFEKRFNAAPYSASLNLNQNIYDFGRTSKSGTNYLHPPGA